MTGVSRAMAGPISSTAGRPGDLWMDSGRVDEALAVAVEHIAWCLGQDWQPYDVFAAIEKPAPMRATWNDAIWAIAIEQELLLEKRRLPGLGRRAA